MSMLEAMDLNKQRQRVRRSLASTTKTIRTKLTYCRQAPPPDDAALNCYQIKNEQVAKQITRATSTAVQALHTYTEFEKAETSFFDRIIKKRAKSITRRATSLVRRRSSDHPTSPLASPENSNDSLVFNLCPSPIADPDTSTNSSTSRGRPGQLISNIEQKMGKDFMEQSKQLIHTEKHVSENAAALGILAEGLVNLGGMRRRYVMEVSEECIEPLRKSSQYQRGPVKHERKKRDRHRLNLQYMRENRDEYDSVAFQEKIALLNGATAKADDANRRIIQDQTIVESVDQFLIAKAEYHRRVLSEVVHMQQLLEESRANAVRNYYLPINGDFVDALPERRTADESATTPDGTANEPTYTTSSPSSSIAAVTSI